ncbi:MAG TPA: CinA family protein [Motilibacteraceae bacterium]|nr:CinA family protein [Motilibacteraceae bacterium]
MSAEAADTGSSAGPAPDRDDVGALAARAVGALSARGLTVGTAESLTGGLVGAALTGVAGSSAVYRGGVVAYATPLKAALLGVDAGLLEREGAVHPQVAQQMAEGARRVLGADVGLATTGVAGPDPQDGRPPGTVHVAVATAEGCRGLDLSLLGDRAGVREQAVRQLLGLLLDTLSAMPSAAGDQGERPR